MSTFERIDLAQFDGITDGPWTVEDGGIWQMSNSTYAARKLRCVAQTVHDPDSDPDIDFRNADDERAILAAPELVAALRAAYAEIDNNDEAIQSYARTVVRMQAEIDRLEAEVITAGMRLGVCVLAATGEVIEAEGELEFPEGLR